MPATPQKPEKVKRGLTSKSPKMDAYTDEQLAEVFEHRRWTNPHKDQLTDEDVKQGLLLIAQAPDIQKVFIRLRNAYQTQIIKLAKDAGDPDTARKLEKYFAKHEFVQRILDRVETVWANRNKKDAGSIDNR